MNLETSHIHKELRISVEDVERAESKGFKIYFLCSFIFVELCKYN